jgi:hypothetical protein
MHSQIIVSGVPGRVSMRHMGTTSGVGLLRMRRVVQGVRSGQRIRKMMEMILTRTRRSWPAYPMGGTQGRHAPLSYTASSWKLSNNSALKVRSHILLPIHQKECTALVLVFSNKKFSLFKCRGNSKQDIANDECGLPNKRERVCVCCEASPSLISTLMLNLYHCVHILSRLIFFVYKSKL